jgi:hypothetical protein
MEGKSNELIRMFAIDTVMSRLSLGTVEVLGLIRCTYDTEAPKDVDKSVNASSIV